MAENSLNPLTLEERVKYIEKASLAFFFFMISYISLLNPESIPPFYGYGPITTIIVFLVSFVFTGWYFGQIGVTCIKQEAKRWVK